MHRREVAALGLSGRGCVTFSVYVLGLVSSPLGVPKDLSWEPCLCKAVFGTFFLDGRSATILGTGIFGNAFALRSVWLAAWDAQNCSTFVALVVCLWNLLPPACAAKVWDAEIFAKLGRHAAFRSRLGWPKIVVRWLHSRLAVGTFFFQGWPLEPSSSKVAPRNFWERKIWRSIGATQRFDRNAGGPKLWQVGWIRGLPSGLAFANLGRENFAYRIF